MVDTNREESTPPAATADMLRAWAPVLPEVVGDQLQLGGGKQLGKFLLNLSFSGPLVVSLDAEGRIHLLAWCADAEGFACADFATEMAGLELPILLLRSKAEAVLLTDRATFLIGSNGLAITKASGEIDFVPAEDIHGIARHPKAQPDAEGNV